MSLNFFLPQNQEEIENNFKSNLDLLNKIGIDCSDYTLRKKEYLFDFSDQEISVYHKNTLLLSDLNDELYANLSKQIEERESTRVGRFISSASELKPENILAEIVDSEEYVFLNQASALKIQSDQEIIQDRFRSHLLMGSLSFLYAYTLLEQNNEESPLSLLLVEENPDQFCLLLQLCSFERIIRLAKQSNTKIQLVLEPGQKDLHICVLNKIFNETALSFHGLRIFRSPLLSAKLNEVCSWFHADDGVINFVKGALGNDTDETNQLINGIWNSCNNPSLKLLTPGAFNSDNPIILTASGPSLDAQISWLKDHHQDFTIVAAGSSVATLLRHDIHVDICVLLEMATTVFKDLNDLAMSGINLSETLLISSITVDPRVGQFFRDQLFFHRPLSAVYSLYEDEDFACLPQAGPQAVNAAFEAMIQLGAKRFLLLGCDFGSTSPEIQRSSSAMGTSPRELTQPIKGSFGKTVYTSPELSVTKQLFENMISANDIHVSSLGEGVYIQGVDVKQIHDIDELKNEFACSFDYTTFLSNLRKRDADYEALSVIFKDSINCIDDRMQQLRSSLMDDISFSSNLFNKLNSFAGWADKDLSPSQKLVHRLSRFSIFFLLQPLFDSYSSNYKERVSSILTSIEQMSSMQKILFELLLKRVETSSDIVYDIDWLRRFILSA